MWPLGVTLYDKKKKADNCKTTKIAPKPHYSLNTNRVISSSIHARNAND